MLPRRQRRVRWIYLASFGWCRVAAAACRFDRFEQVHSSASVFTTHKCAPKTANRWHHGWRIVLEMYPPRMICLASTPYIFGMSA
ncbi:hypothetical protein L207DRAFT_168943 [Hyaloscypha variabilis F]|uniref:Secreted protein n=1 Tax=Hyaloscypha variabilis (strain UAMH 11265 / GT02V1 / F) TaxID=1149755 RepID=A0A2J6R472_HYAVF|nr:hypothetical protein L207DRAFT_168943 [Hyaloscypha variabilis F]